MTIFYQNTCIQAKKLISDNNKAQNANEKNKKRQFFFTIITDKSQYGKTEIIATTYLPFQ